MTEVVDHVDIVMVFDQYIHHCGTDKTGAPGNDDSHTGNVTSTHLHPQGGKRITNTVDIPR